MNSYVDDESYECECSLELLDYLDFCSCVYNIPRYTTFEHG